MERPSIIQENIPLAPYTTFKIGGPAKYLAVIKRSDDVSPVLAWAKQEGLNIRILGKGANTLVGDKGYDGLVIIMQNDQMQWTPPQVIIGTGTQNGQLIANALKHHLGGMRWLIGVPGTVGGSLYGNAGGHGWGLGDFVDWVDVITFDGEQKRLTKEECHFAYRTSEFKAHRDWVIVQAQLTLPAIDHAEEHKLLAETTKQKGANQPITTQTAGCMFVNPVVEKDKLPAELQPFVENNTLSAWRLLQHLDIPGKKIGGVEISSKHANFMVNTGGATADHVIQMLSYVKQQVRDQLGVQLHEEVQYLGF